MTRVKFGLLMVSVMMLVTGCIKVPIGDGATLKVSKEGVTISDEEGNETDVAFDEEEGNLNISGGKEGDEINVNVGLDSELPEDFPKEIPIVNDATIMQAADMSEGDQHGYMIMYFSEKQMNEVTEVYEDFIKTSGFELIDSQMDTEQLFEEGTMFQTMRGEEEYFMVNIFEDDSEEGKIVTVSITYMNAK